MYSCSVVVVVAFVVVGSTLVVVTFVVVSATVVCSSIISCIIAYVLTFFYEKSDISHSLSYIGGCLCGMLITISLMYPLIFKYGWQKGRIAGFVLIAGSGFVLGLLSKIKVFSTVVNSFEIERIGQQGLAFDILLLVLPVSVKETINLASINLAVFAMAFAIASLLSLLEDS